MGKEILRFNKKDGALYLALNPDRKASIHEDVAEGITVDLAFGNELVGIEILGVNDWPDKIKAALLKYFEGDSVNDD
ncbi:MAG TPA: DUF2283 domain-containing protein [Candidatus Wallbacteria bacterium]|nr:DUF2283 domain-containing protein [Candidatus Wallbacteria bacterium]